MQGLKKEAAMIGEMPIVVVKKNAVLIMKDSQIVQIKPCAVAYQTESGEIVNLFSAIKDELR